MKHLFLAGLLAVGAAGCQGYDRGVREEPTLSRPTACQRQEVYCYLTNYSNGDTLLVAPAQLVVDDSLLISEQVPRTSSSSERLSKVVQLCVGTHRVHVQFGPYARDTTFVVRGDTAISLVATMLCHDVPELAHEDGLSLVTLLHDGKRGPD
jgi:hypothetical protein